MRALLLCSLLACSTPAAQTSPDAGSCPVLPACGTAPAMPETHPTWTTVSSKDVLVFNDADGRALVDWTWRVTAWQNCMSGTK